MTTINQTQQQQQQQQQKSSSNSQLSLSDVSKIFNLPLSDAADSLGVSTSTLKKVCQDNGLVRWPHRKFLSGKSIEDIIKEVAQERKMEPVELSKSTKDRNNVTKITILSGGSVLNKTTSSVQEIPRARSITHQQGTKTTQNATPSIDDEFKYGFPSDGLSRISNKWWGSSTADNKNGTHGKEDNHQNKDDSQNKDKVDFQSATDESNTARKLLGAGLLSALRKRAVDEGRKALRLGVHRGSSINKPGKREKALLHGIFGDSLPK